MKQLTLIILLAFAVSANAADKDPVLAMQFNTICTTCKNTAELYPLKIVSRNSGTSTNGGVIQGVTLTFRCVRDKTPAQKRCRKEFKQEAKVFVPTPPMATPVGAGQPPEPSFQFLGYPGGNGLTNMWNSYSATGITNLPAVPK